MMKFIRSEYAFLAASLLFFIVAAGSARPAVFIALGAVFLVLALAVRKKRDQGGPPPSSGA